MTPADLTAYRDDIASRHKLVTEAITLVDSALDSEQSVDHRSDAYAEALFLRAFTAYEIDLEKLFLHYVTGGLSLDGQIPNTYIKLTDEAAARKLTKGGYKFLSWAKPSEITRTATTYIHEGWPLSSVIASKTQDLADCERVRNRIAHNSIEALASFDAVQRNMLHTERTFFLSPGQFLRIRSIRLKKLHLSHYIDVMNATLEAILTPPK